MRHIGKNVIYSVYITAAWAGLLVMSSTGGTSHANLSAGAHGGRPRDDHAKESTRVR